MHGSALIDVLVLLTAAVIAVPLFQRLGIGPVLGYLAAGVMVGPAGFGLIESTDEIHALAELGVVFLLFAIGLEMKLARLWVMRRLVFGLGTLQVLVTGATLGLALHALGLPIEAAVVAGGGLALSSTAVVLQILTDRGELNTRPGRIAFSILLLQDLAVVPLLALVSVLTGEGTGVPAALGLAVVQAGAALALIIGVGRFLLRPLLHVVARSRSTEIFAAAAVLLVLGTAWLTGKVGLSMAFGAFLAGLMLAETEFRHQVEADIQPFRGFLLGLFFMTVGMSIDIGLVVREAGIVLPATLALLVVKAALIFLLARAFSASSAHSLHVAILLAQGGEFGFILFGLAGATGILDRETSQVLILSVSLTMMVTPLLAVVASRLSQRLSREQPSARALDEAEPLHDHIIIAGFGRVGQTVAKMLAAEHVHYLALDMHAERVAEGLSRGLPVYFADASRPEVLRAAGADHARAVVVTLDQPKIAERTVAVLRHAFPHARVYARARDRQHGEILRQAGATMTVPETLEASLQLGATVLRAMGVTTIESARLVDEFRAADYAKLGELIETQAED
ncbi:MAG: cation:proton antiporter, partial [Alphaproteobacteria bacterium]|nr:cation:proton antiporter [Alphaproteobacteria bacterium]